MKNNVAYFDKHVGETPLEALQRFRLEQPQYAESKLAYAGRLDPQARGQLLILIDEECKNRDHYQNLDKVYEFEILAGVSSDTGDVMGMLDYGELPAASEDLEQSINASLASIEGEIELPYPAYSSKTVDGVPLWKIAREGKLDQIEIPSKTVTIYSIDYLGKREIGVSDLVDDVTKRIRKVTGDFRQEEIITSWQDYAEFLQANSIDSLPIFKFSAQVSSGTYIRTLGSKILAPSLCVDINRTKVITGK